MSTNELFEPRELNEESQLSCDQPKDDNGEFEPEPSEEDTAIASLDQEHFEDYLAIKRAVEHTDLAERLVDLAVRIGLSNRKKSINDQEIPF